MTRGVFRLAGATLVLLLAAGLGALLLLLLSPRAASGQGAELRLRRAMVMVVGVDPELGVVSLMEKLALQNDAGAPYQPPRWQDSALRFALPVGAGGMALEAGPPGAELLPLGNGIYTLAAPLPPGEVGLVISYALPYEEGSRALRVARGAAMPAESLQVLALAARGIELRPVGRSLGAATETAIGDQRYVVLDGKNVAAGTDTSFEVRGLPARTTSGATALRGLPGGQLAEPPLVATAALLLGAALVYGALQR